MEIRLIILKIFSLLYFLALNSSHLGLFTAGLPVSSNHQVHLRIYFSIFPLYIFNCYSLVYFIGLYKVCLCMYIHGHGCIMHHCFSTLLFLSASIRHCLYLQNNSVSSSLYIHDFLLAYCTSLALSLFLPVSLSMTLTISPYASYYTCLSFVLEAPTFVCLSNYHCLSLSLSLSPFQTTSVSPSN